MFLSLGVHLNCPRQATRSGDLKASCLWRTQEEDGLLFRNTAAASAASWTRAVRRVLPDQRSLCEITIAGSVWHCQQLCGQPCYKPSTKISRFGCCYGNSTIMANWVAMGTERKWIEGGWSCYFRSHAFWLITCTEWEQPSEGPEAAPTWVWGL